LAIIKPAAEPCTLEDIHTAGGLERGEASTPSYRVWSSDGWTQNGTIKVGGIGFPAHVGQQACLFGSYEIWPNGGGCEWVRGAGSCHGETQTEYLLLAARAFVPEHTVAAASPTPPPAPSATPTPAPPVRPTLTRAERLKLALKQCRRRHHRTHARVLCERRARRKYRAG
jgi:hypothetical protein